MGRLTNKYVLVTGGGSGIGRTTARILSEEGAKVVVTDINFDSVTQTAEEIGASVIAIKHDVTKAESWKDVLEFSEAHLGELNVLVNCAGIAALGNIEETTFEDWKRIHSKSCFTAFYHLSTLHDQPGQPIGGIPVFGPNSHVSGAQRAQRLTRARHT